MPYVVSVAHISLYHSSRVDCKCCCFRCQCYLWHSMVPVGIGAKFGSDAVSESARLLIVLPVQPSNALQAFLCRQEPRLITRRRLQRMTAYPFLAPHPSTSLSLPQCAQGNDDTRSCRPVRYGPSINPRCRVMQPYPIRRRRNSYMAPLCGRCTRYICCLDLVSYGFHYLPCERRRGRQFPVNCFRMTRRSQCPQPHYSAAERGRRWSLLVFHFKALKLVLGLWHPHLH